MSQISDAVSYKIAEAAQTLKEGGVIACPTEGVFGLSARVNDVNAVQRVISIKHRALNKGLIVVASDIAMLEGTVNFAQLSQNSMRLIHEKWPGHATFIVPAHPSLPSVLTGSDIAMLEGTVNFAQLSQNSMRLIHEKWPGHATFIVPAHPSLPSVLTGGRNTVAVRVSAFPLLQELCRQTNCPIVSTSANISGTAHPSLPSVLTGGRNTVAVRVSAFPLLQELCRQTNCPIVSTSANISGNEPVADLEELKRVFGFVVDYILDEPCQGLSKPSTIYDAMTGAILRP